MFHPALEAVFVGYSYKNPEMSYNSESATQQAEVNKYLNEAEEKCSGTMFTTLLAKVFLGEVEENELKV